MFENLNIVYVDDELMNRKVMELLLNTILNIKNVAMFEDSQDFVNRLKALPFVPDVILLDIHIEPCTGYEMLEQLQTDASFSYAKVVAVTASLHSEEIRRIRECGFDGVIAKPISMHTFPDILQRVLEGDILWDTI